MSNNNQGPQHDANSAKITSLATLRALQKAAKQVVDTKNEITDPLSKIEVPKPRVQQAPPVVEIKNREKSPPPTLKKGQVPKSPDDINNYELRKTFQIALSKLYTLETKDLALNELKTIIMNNLSPRNLRIFLSSLSEYKKVDNPTTQEIEVFLLGFLANQFKEEMIDPLDKVPGLIKTCFRVIEAIQSYFKVSAPNVATACGSSIRQIYSNCLRRETVENKSLVLYEPLAIIISGGTDRVSQTTASLCLCDLLLAVIEMKDYDFLEDIRQKFVVMFLKINYEISDLIKATGILLGSSDIRMSGNRLHRIIEKLLKYAQTTSGNYVIKIEVSNTLGIIALRLMEIAESFIGTLHEEVISVLKNLSKDRLIKVQNSANEALRLWNNLKVKLQSLETKKMTRDIIEHNPDEIIKRRTGLDVNEEMNLGKLLELNVSPHEKIEYQDDPNNPYFQEKYQKGLKKKSGTGGGFVVLEKDKRPSSAVYSTENKKKQNIRDQIQKSGGPIRERNDKFDTVKYLGMEFSDASHQPKDSLVFKKDPSKSQLHPLHPSEMSFNPLLTQKEISPDNKQLRSQTSMQNQASWQAQSEVKKERQMELTQQLMSLQNQGYIKTVPKGQIVNSLEGPLMELNSQASPTFPREFGEKNQLSNVFNGDKKTLQGSFDVRQFDITNAFSQSVNSMNQTYKDQQFEQSKNFENQTRNQKDFLIRSSKNLSQKQKPSENTNLHNAIGRGVGKQEGELDLEDTLPFELAETSSYKKKPENAAQALSRVWDEALKDLEKKDLENAFERVLATGDDIYLLRLMSKTGPCLEQLNRKTALAVTNRIVQLSGTNFMDNVFMEVVKEGFDLDLVDQLNIEEQDQLLEELYCLSANETTLGKKANDLYSVLLTQINS